HVDLIIERARRQGMEYRPAGMTRGPLGQMIPVPGMLASLARINPDPAALEPAPVPRPMTRDAGRVYVAEVRAATYREARSNKAALGHALKAAGIDGE